MNIASLVASLATRGIQLWAEGDQLRFRGPKGALTADDRAALAAHRPAVLDHLRAIGETGEATDAATTRTVPRLRSDDPKPMSFAQERLWFFDQVQPGSHAYNLPLIARLVGRIDYAAFESALNAVLARHDVLRADFGSREGQPVQTIAPASRYVIPIRDVPAGSNEDRERLAVEMATAEYAKPFDLAHGPAIRVTIIRLDDENHVVVVVLHHIVGDGWSLGIFGREIGELYRARLTGDVAALPELQIQYADFAAWQRESTTDALTASLAYWLKRLDHAPPAIDLPLDRRRPAMQGLVGAAHTRRIDPVLGDRLRVLSRENNATLFMTLLSAFYVVLSRQSGQHDICIGVPVSGRSLPETEPLIGLFVDNVVMRTSVEAGATFRDVIAAVRETTLGAFAHQGVPFEQLVDKLLPTRDLSRTPLFQVLFNALSFGDTKQANLWGTQGEQVPNTETTGSSARFDLTLYFTDEPQGILLTAVYGTALFDGERIEDLLEQMVQVLDAATVAPQTQIASYSLVTPRAAGILPDPRAPLPASWHNAIHERFRVHAIAAPQRIAAADSRRAWTYGDLETRSNQLANDLLDQGIGREDRVAIFAARNAGLAWAMLGVLKAGAAFVVVDPAYPPERTIACLRIAEPRGWIDVTNGAPVPAPIEQHLAAIPNLVRASWTATADDATGRWYTAGSEMPAITIAADDLAYVVFTSGSTGVPKGIAGTHGPLAHFFAWHAATSSFVAEDRFSVLSGLAHDPLLRDVLAPFWVGASVFFPDADQFMSPGYLAGWMTANEITVSHMTPAVADLVTLASAHGRGVALPSLRRGFFGGDVLTTTTVDALRAAGPQAHWANFYGASETPQAIAWNPLPRARDDSLPARVPLGRGIEGVQLLVINDAGGLAGIGELGEIHVRTPHLARGYIGDASLTAARFIVNPFTGDSRDRMYRTGDMGRFRLDGSVEFFGRRDGQLKVRGFRIEAGEVEAALRAHTGVSEAAVAVVTAEPVGEQLVAYVVPAQEGAALPDDMRAFLRTRLPDHMIPTRYLVLPALPLTPNGKIDRQALPAPMERPPASRASLRTPMERDVAAIWSEVLGGKEIGGDDSFFELGGHSLLATRVFARVRARLGADLPVRTIFEAPTLAEFARLVEAARGAAPEREDVVI